MQSKSSSLFKRGYLSIPKKEETPITLDTQQERAVYSKSSDILVVASAGSGKTRVITERIKYLLETGVSPHNIVAITFTNMAAEEMKERLSSVDRIGDAFIGTIHSFANRVMRLSGDTYRIYDDAIDNDMHRELINKYCKFMTFDRYLKYKDLKDAELLGKVSDHVVQSFLCPSERAELTIIEKGATLREVVEISATMEDYPENIKELCKERGIITFNELLRKAEKYFRGNDAKIEHVLVDEFQDVGTLEFNFIEALQADNYYLVGDDWQSIYSFKGGNVKIFMKLIEDGHFEVHYLTHNYRNCKAVLDIAETVIEQVSHKIDKSIIPVISDTGSVEIKSRSKLESLLLELCHKNNKKNELKNWFFLCRSNKDVYDLVAKCDYYEIPCTTFKREGMSLSDLRSRMDSNRVKILTVHTAKGLEIDNVLLYGNFPVQCPNYLNDEEERKVMYVGITRAKKKLIIMN